MSDSIFTRREILAAFLGAPFALAACRTRGQAEALPEGVIVGASDRVGHALRAHGVAPRLALLRSAVGCPGDEFGAELSRKHWRPEPRFV